MRHPLLLLLAACLLFAGCRGTSTSSHQAPSPTVSNDIQRTMQGLLTAALSGDVSAFASYLSSSCGDPTKAIAVLGAVRSLLPEGNLTVNLSHIDAEMIDETHLSVTGLSGLSVSVNNTPLPSGVALSLTKPRFRFVLEAGQWRLENCQDLGS